MSVAIRTEGIAKRYRVGQDYQAYGTLRDTLASGFRNVYLAARGRAAQDQSRFIWALKDVSIEVQTGEILGIVGPNGSGKSTLLKILARVTRPTSGRALIDGRVGSLLEVGTGFHAELTGRENVYLNGAILGMKRAEIARKFDAIVSFSEIEQFLDTPVKRYSTGMYMRLAFAVAAHLDPDILLVDEVLAVGDVAFQRKCLGAMEQASRDGRTVVFVSHNMVAIQSLCDRAVWLSGGQVISDGRSADVVASYLHSFTTGDVTQQVWDDQSSAPGNDQVRMRSVRVVRADAAPTVPVTMRTPIAIEIEYWNLVPQAYLNVYIHLVTEAGVVAFESSPLGTSALGERPLDVGLYRSTCHVPGDLLNAGQLRVLLFFVRDGHHTVYQENAALLFEVHDAPELRTGWYGEIAGVVRPRLKWTTKRSNEPRGAEPSGRATGR